MLSKEYSILLAGLKEKIRNSRSVAVLTVNSQMLAVYWEIGNTIDDLEKASGWGAKTVDRLAADLKDEFPEMKGLSPRSLRYMREFSKAYPEFPILQQAAAKLLSKKSEEKGKRKNRNLQQPAANLRHNSMKYIALMPWAHHQLILDKLKTEKERLFYIQKTVEQGWSRDILSLQIESGLYGRVGKSITNFKTTLPKTDSDLAQQTFKNPYFLDFLDISGEIKERDLERSLIQHIKKFILELGRGFAYVGNQFKIKIEEDDYFLDLLFFNYKLNCFVVFELKIGDFQPEFAGKLNFYINAVDAQIKEEKHAHTIGVLLCKTPNATVIRYALEGVEKPIAVSDFKLAQELPKAYRAEMPTTLELEQELEKEVESFLTPAEKRLATVFEKIKASSKEPLLTAATFAILKRLFKTSIKPLFLYLLARLEQFRPGFLSATYYWFSRNEPIKSVDDLELFWNDEQRLRANKEIQFQYRLSGLKAAGIDAFDIVAQLNIVIDDYRYSFVLINYNDQQPFMRKLYISDLADSDIREIGDLICNQIMDRMESRI